MKFTITDLKKHLGPGLGLRKNKYLLEIPVPGVEGEKINILARSAGLPERNITTQQVWYHGRRYSVRGETDYIGTYEVSILDDSDMKIRKTFDKWLKKVDNSKPENAGILGASNEAGLGQIIDNIKSGIGVANQIKNAVENPAEEIGGFFLGALDAGQASSIAKYQTDINIWQLSALSDKIYGYKLENAFPQQVGIVTLDDGDENTMSEFSVTFAFSEFTPLENTSITEDVFRALVGDNASETYDAVSTLFD
jgi:hypothetical protein